MCIRDRLNIDSDGRIYSLGRDSVGPYLVVGSRWSDNSAQLVQKYFEDYEIEYNVFCFQMKQFKEIGILLI